MTGNLILISSPFGLRIPSEIAGGKVDLVVAPHDAVSVPADYAKHLISDGFASEAPAQPTKAAADLQPESAPRKRRASKTDDREGD